MINTIQTLTALPEHSKFIEALLNSKGFMFIKEDSITFPFNDNHRGFVYTFICNTNEKIHILDILNHL